LHFRAADREGFTSYDIECNDPESHFAIRSIGNFQPGITPPSARQRRIGQRSPMFVAIGASFEAKPRRIVDIDDGVTDALFRFTQPLTGAYYGCLPVTRGRWILVVF
jgi:hypothetical protein